MELQFQILATTVLVATCMAVYNDEVVGIMLLRKISSNVFKMYIIFNIKVNKDPLNDTFTK